jgi:indolepyruvate ferredoxin oxidoreductase beta subunit
MTTKTAQPLRILLAALGGEGGGVLMGWIVAAAREAGLTVQATSVPGVAQRSGSTSYYVEIAQTQGEAAPVLGLVPMPGRVDVVLSSELVETARAMTAGYVSPNLTTLISSTARFYSTAEKIAMGDGRYSSETIAGAAEKLAKKRYLLDLGQLATDHGTFVSATMFGALAGSGVLPWGVEHSRSVLSEKKSLNGFDAACAAVVSLRQSSASDPVQSVTPVLSAAVKPAGTSKLPEEVTSVIGYGYDLCEDFQDTAYAETYLQRALKISDAADLSGLQGRNAVTEACRRLALWMAYEDIARAADLKTRPERFERIRNEVQLKPGQILTLTEYMKPRAEEIADILPRAWGARIMARVARGGWFPLLGRGIYLRSNGGTGYWLLRLAAQMRRIRRRSYRYAEEQAAIDIWLDSVETALPRAPGFAEALAELPRVRKGYSDTLMRGKLAYDRIIAEVVQPAIQDGTESRSAGLLRQAIAAALADETHGKLDQTLSGDVSSEPSIPNLKAPANA